MKIRNLLIAGAAVATLLGAQAASAASFTFDPSKVTGSVIAGGNSVDGGTDFGAAVGYDVTPTIGAELEYDHTTGRIYKGVNPETSQVQLDAIYHLPTVNGFAPYAVAGFGGRFSEDTRFGRNLEEGTWNVGAGVNRDITKKVFVGARFEYVQGFESSKNEALWTGRVGYRF